MENLSLIDVSSEDDLLISSSSDRHRDLRSSESVDAREEGNPVKMSKQWGHVPEKSESPEQKRAKSGKVNLRKSLAWDSAFTSEGVLNTEELAIVNSTFRKIELCSLPGIQEDLRLSTESTSTLDGESYKLENLEGDLFENVRASIQQSLSKHNNCPSGKSDTPRICSRKKVEVAFQTKMKRPVTLKRDGISGQRLECNSKEAVLGAKEAAKETGVSKLLLKPPQVVPKSIVPSNKGSSGSTQMKDNTRTLSGNGANRQGIVTFNKGNEVSTRMTSRPVSSMKPNASSHLGTMLRSTSSCLSNSSPLNSLSHLKDNSPLERRRKRNASKNSEQPLSGSKQQNISHSKSRASSTFKFSSGASPSSSMDSIISEATSSTSTIKPSSSVESFASSTSSSPSLRVATHQPRIRKESSVNLLHARPIANVPAGTRVLSESSNKDHPRSSINNNTGLRGSKPSGLRMPSPKIGYFDAEKSLVRNSNKISQIGLRSSLLKGNSGTSADAVGTNRPKSSKTPSIRPAARKDSSPISIEESQSMVHKGTQAAYQLDKEEKLEQSGTFDSASVRVEKENLIPAHEMNCLTRSPIECQKLPALDIMGKKMSSLSISSDLVGGN
ncbi:uncharacterized protein DDB_G0271670-like isoform X2 [Asparagus officinalis]|uniref:uncharacterized protein DDB_G0271670-like isoform X2 n=1 Tax=Asparagus officinalis TaxID=4686 RepID=UPI00098DE50B|nr:uncharacterized protein DDB_G0271670-like isoform X2 [Asparagus officinalis]